VSEDVVHKVVGQMDGLAFEELLQDDEALVVRDQLFEVEPAGVDDALLHLQQSMFSQLQWYIVRLD